MSVYTDMSAKLCEFFKSYNIYFVATSQQYEELIQQMNESINILNVDYANAAQLDILASNLAIERGSQTDDALRRRIKTEIIARRSRGDLLTIREVIRLLLGENGLDGILETWEQPRFGNKPAGIVVRLSDLAEYDILIPDETINRVVAGGVAVYYDLVSTADRVLIVEDDSEVILYSIVSLQCGTFQCGTRSLGVLF